MSGSGLSCLCPLFVPATRIDRFAKAAASGADAIIIDLEDAVPPEAKITAREALDTKILPNAPTFLRINGFATAWYAGDLEIVRRLGITSIVLPKCERPDEIANLRAVLGPIEIIALIETAKGLANARTIAGAGAARLAFGSIDLSADLGCSPLREVLVPARAEIVLASRLAGLCPPLDGITMAINDPPQVLGDAQHACAMGFGGKMCIHPSQIAHVKAGFRPSAADMAWAEAIAAVPGDGVVNIEGTMVDAPVRARARQILARQKAAG